MLNFKRFLFSLFRLFDKKLQLQFAQRQVTILFSLYVNRLVSDYVVDIPLKMKAWIFTDEVEIYRYANEKRSIYNWKHDFKISPVQHRKKKTAIFSGKGNILVFYSSFILDCSDLTFIILMATITHSSDYSAFTENNRLYLHFSLFGCVYSKLSRYITLAQGHGCKAIKTSIS